MRYVYEELDTGPFESLSLAFSPSCTFYLYQYYTERPFVISATLTTIFTDSASLNGNDNEL